MKALGKLLKYIVIRARRLQSVLLFLSGLVTVVFAAWVFSGHFFLERTVEMICGSDVSECSINMDVVKVASEIGRLDLVSMMLTAVGILLVFLAIVTFAYTKSEAENTAKECTEKWLEDNMPRLAKEVAEALKSNPEILKSTLSEDADEYERKAT